MSVIIDRRLNDRNKSAVNRERFIRRYKAHIQRAVSDMVADRSIKDMEHGGQVKIPVKDVSEPSFRQGGGGDREMVHPGNRKFMPGDRIKRPEGGGEGDGKGSDGGQGEGEDGFTFTLSREEFMEIFFDDLELPNMERTRVGDIREYKWQRAGYTPQGSPVNLSVARSLRNALGRRIALTSASRKRLAHLQALLERRAENDAEIGAPVPAGFDPDVDPRADPDLEPALDREAIDAEINELRRRIARVPFLDEIDLRYRHRVQVAQPMSQAVMFCLMDVSASMDENKKDLAKRFFTLLYLFLSRKYERVEVVFIRHTDDAEEVDEDRFFHDPKTGGTVVLSALHLMHEIIEKRYPSNLWNIYGAQASDGDAFGADPEKSRGFLEEQLLPRLRYFAYIEAIDERSRLSTLSAAYRRIEAGHFAMREVSDRRDIYPVFRGLFSKAAAVGAP
ncbi:MAG: YeaH/YhbH family protein [Burkholderiaceae bacterium]